MKTIVLVNSNYRILLKEKEFVKKMFVNISQNSQENTSSRVSFLIKLQARGILWHFVGFSDIL